MDTIKPLNDQPVELTLSFESVRKIEVALAAAKVQLAGKRREVLQEITQGNTSYFGQIVCESLASEITYLADLQRALTMRMDNVADDYKLAKSPEFPEFVEPIPTCVSLL